MGFVFTCSAIGLLIWERCHTITPWEAIPKALKPETAKRNQTTLSESSWIPSGMLIVSLLEVSKRYRQHYYGENCIPEMQVSMSSHPKITECQKMLPVQTWNVWHDFEFPFWFWCFASTTIDHYWSPLTVVLTNLHLDWIIGEYKGASTSK